MRALESRSPKLKRNRVSYVLQLCSLGLCHVAAAGRSNALQSDLLLQRIAAGVADRGSLDRHGILGRARKEGKTRVTADQAHDAGQGRGRQGRGALHEEAAAEVELPGLLGALLDVVADLVVELLELLGQVLEPVADLVEAVLDVVADLVPVDRLRRHVLARLQADTAAGALVLQAQAAAGALLVAAAGESQGAGRHAREQAGCAGEDE
ncbi:uncharacterized protein PG998_011802 [Apiospora kogelbergensis]|uniref:uncharacterized protein n=1 Tax=Apiospora kogelbergensis TaxID=1337665 RepID=UPI0031310004